MTSERVAQEHARLVDELVALLPEEERPWARQHLARVPPRILGRRLVKASEKLQANLYFAPTEADRLRARRYVGRFVAHLAAGGDPQARRWIGSYRPKPASPGPWPAREPAPLPKWVARAAGELGRLTGCLGQPYDEKRAWRWRRVKSQRRDRPLSPEALAYHLAGRASIAITAGERTSWVAVDVDAHDRAPAEAAADCRRVLEVVGPAVVVSSPGLGYHVWLPLDRPYRRGEMVERVALALRAAGVEVAPGRVEVLARLRAPLGPGSALLDAATLEPTTRRGPTQWRHLAEQWRAARRSPAARFGRARAARSGATRPEAERQRPERARRWPGPARPEAERRSPPMRISEASEFRARCAALILGERAIAPGTRHAELLRLAWYCKSLGMGEADGWAHVERVFEALGPVRLADSRREWPHAYAGNRARNAPGPAAGSEPCAPALEALVGLVREEARDEARRLLHNLAWRAGADGRVPGIVELSANYLARVCGERRLRGDGRPRVGQAVIEDLVAAGVLEMAGNYAVGRCGRRYRVLADLRTGQVVEAGTRASEHDTTAAGELAIISSSDTGAAPLAVQADVAVASPAELAIMLSSDAGAAPDATALEWAARLEPAIMSPSAAVAPESGGLRGLDGTRGSEVAASSMAAPAALADMSSEAQVAETIASPVCPVPEDWRLDWEEQVAVYIIDHGLPEDYAMARATARVREWIEGHEQERATAAARPESHVPTARVRIPIPSTGRCGQQGARPGAAPRDARVRIPVPNTARVEPGAPMHRSPRGEPGRPR